MWTANGHRTVQLWSLALAVLRRDQLPHLGAPYGVGLSSRGRRSTGAGSLAESFPTTANSALALIGELMARTPSNPR
jgi:hypothetical protein